MHRKLNANTLPLFNIPTSILKSSVKNRIENGILQHQSSCIMMVLFKTLENYINIIKIILNMHAFSVKLSYINLGSLCLYTVIMINWKCLNFEREAT